MVTKQCYVCGSLVVPLKSEEVAMCATCEEVQAKETSVPNELFTI